MIEAPLSYQQQELLDNTSRYPQCMARYDWMSVYELAAETDLETLTSAVEGLADRHEALRTTVEYRDGQGRQLIHPGLAAPVERREVPEAELPDVLATTAAGRMTVEQVGRSDALFRPIVITSGNRILLALNIHHLVHDGASEAVMWRDLSEFYSARQERRPAELPELPLSYAEFTAWQRNEWERIGGRAVYHWRAALDGLPATLSWPTSPEGSPEEPPESLRNAAKGFSVGPEAAEALRMAARRGRVSPFMVIAAVSAAAVGRVTGNEDLLLGVPSANREEPFKHEMVGHFANTRLVQARGPEDPGLSGLTRSIRASWFDCEDFRDVYSRPLLTALGAPEVVYVAMNAVPGAVTAPTFAGKEATRVPVRTPGVSDDWRSVGVMWEWGDDGLLHGQVRHRLSIVSSAAADDIAAAATELMSEL
ncbi:hypothetical protein ABH926_007762 [Catenulispora sp. GP43]|uniref:condensation domain-containing protein n=1 Tax=Catenulispora sp. GP43 TaxID=3156263 RepID=UPI0035152FBD